MATTTEPASPAASNGSEPESSQPAPRRPRGASLLFRAPAEAQSPLETPETASPAGTSSPLDGPVDGSPSLSDELPAESGEGDLETSSRGSSASTALSKVALRKATRSGVLMAGSFANANLTRDELERDDVQLWVADDDDAAAIGDPIANLAARRGGLAGAAANPDLGDVIAMLVGIAVYVSKQLQKLQVVRQYRRAKAAHDVQQPDQPAGDPNYP